MLDPSLIGDGSPNSAPFTENPFGEIDASQFDGLYDDPDSLTVCPDPAECQSMIDLLGSSNDVLASVNNENDFEGFADRSDPFAVVGDTFGTEAYCDPETGDIIHEEEIVEEYQCFDSYETVETQDVCDVPLEVTVTADYEYNCVAPTVDVCVGAYRNRVIYEGSVYVDYGDYDQSDTPYRDFQRDVNDGIFGSSDCYADIDDTEFYEDNEVPVTYVCYESYQGDPDRDFHYNWVQSSRINCLDNYGGRTPFWTYVISVPGPYDSLFDSDCRIVDTFEDCNGCETEYTYECPRDQASNGIPHGSVGYRDIANCTPFEENQGCSQVSEGCATEPSNIKEAVSCVPDGQTAQGVSCTRQRAHELEVIFSYDCQYVLDEATGELRPDPKCVDFLNDDSCTRGDAECVQNAELQYDDVSCQLGDRLTYADESCVANRVGYGDQRFTYSGYENFETSTASFANDKAKQILDDHENCLSTDHECVVEAPIITEPAICREGYELVDTSYNCELPRVIETDEDYVYGTRRSWNAASAAHLAIDNYGPLLTSIEECASIGERCEVETPPSYEDHTCLQGYRYNTSYESCEVDREITVETDYGYVGKEVYNEVLVDARLGGPSDQWSENLYDPTEGWSQDVNGPHIGEDAYSLTQSGYRASYLREARFTRTQGPNHGSVVSLLTGQLDSGVAGGGAYGPAFEIDHTKAYEWSIYVKLEELDKHRIYFGLTGTVQRGSVSSTTGNPYFWTSFAQASGGYEANVWYKIVGYVLPSNHPNEGSRYGGLFDTRTGERLGGPADHFRWTENSTSTNLRFFNFYSNEHQGQFTHFYKPQVREINLGAVLEGGVDLSYNNNPDGITSGFVKDAVYEAAANAQCNELDRTCTLEYETRYEELTCEVGFDVDDELVELTRERIIDYDIDYIYQAYSNFETGSGFIDTAELDNLQTVSTCEKTDRICSIEGSGVFSMHVCNSGYTDRTSNESCRVPLNVATDSDYIYQATEFWSSNQFRATTELANLRLQNHCQQQDRFCSRQSPGVFDEYVCQTGYDRDYRNVSYRRLGVPEFDTDYFYEVTRSWNGTKTAALVSLETDNSCEFEETYCSQVTPQQFEYHSCRQGYQDNVIDMSCQRQRTVEVDLDYTYTVDRVWNTSTLRWTGEADWNKARSTTATNAQCEKVSEICAQQSNGVFSQHICQEGYRIDDGDKTCIYELGFETETDYIYTGYETWNGASFVKDTTLVRIGQQAASRSCTRESVTNELPVSAAERTSKYECVRGDIEYTAPITNVTCNVPRVVTTGNVRWYRYEVYSGDDDESNLDHDCELVDEYSSGDDESIYIYECPSDQTSNLGYSGYAVWRTGVTSNSLNTSACNSAINAGGALVSETCTQGQQTRNINGVSVSAPCWNYSRTYQTGGNVATCEATLNVSVVNNSGYVYEQSEFRPRGQSWYPNSPMRSNPACNYVSVRYTHHSWGSFRRPTFHCTSHQGNLGYKGRVSDPVITDNWNSSACNTAASQGSLQGSVCIEGPSTKIINGVPVYRACWKERRTYSGPGNVVSVDTCVPPAGYVYKRQTNYSPSPMLGNSRTLKKREYEKVETLANSANVKAPHVCMTGYWINDAGRRYDYSCNQPGGSVQRDSDCAWRDDNNVCRLYTRSYIVPNGKAPNGYGRHKEVWSCDTQVTGSGVAAPVLDRSFKNFVWWESSSCDVPASNFSEGCTLETQGYVGPNTTKTVDGFSLTRQFQYEQKFSCENRVNINTCSALLASNDNGSNMFADFDYEPRDDEPKQYVKLASLDLKGLNWSIIDAGSEIEYQRSGVGNNSPPVMQYAAVGDYTLDSQRCLHYVGSTCTLWERHYDREEVDGSGGCLRQTETYTCEEAVSGMGTAQISREIVSDVWEWPSADCQEKLAQYDGCVYQNQTLNSASGAVRNINGLNVSRTSWILDRNYTCTTRVETDTCNPPQGSTVADVSCVWRDSNGVCRLSDYDYELLLPDPTNGCTTHTDKYLCEERNHGNNFVDTYRHFERLSYPRSAAHEADRNDDRCTRLGQRYGGGRLTQVIDGINVTPAAPQQWYLDENYRCYEDTQIDTCNVPENSTLVQDSCLSTIDGGECSLVREVYSVELPDPSGGCHEWTEEYRCENELSFLEPVGIPVEEAGSELDLSACAAYETQFESVLNTTVGSVHRFDFDVPTASNWIEIENANGLWLHLGEVRIFGLNSSGNEVDITELHRDELTATQGSTWPPPADNFPALHAVDGNISSFNHTNNTDPVLRIGFPDGYRLTRIELVNRHNFDGGRLAGAVVRYEQNNRLCERVNEVCVQGSATRMINGASIYKDCWEWSYSYECTQREEVNSCSPQATAVLDSEECQFTDEYGVCTLVEYTYLNEEHDPSGGCDQYEYTYECSDEVTGLSYSEIDVTISREYWDSQPFTDMIAQYQNCEYVPGSIVYEPSAVRDYEELRDLTRSWSGTWTYDCFNRTSVDMCAGFPEGSSEISSVCADEYRGDCVLDEKTYSVPIIDQAGGCAEYSTNFRCDNELSEEFTTYTEFKAVSGDDYDLSVCDNLTSSFETCRLERSFCSEGAGTRLIDGLEVTRDCWQIEREYSCETREVFDTCVVPQEAVNIQSNCVWNDRVGTCRLFENTYQIELPDPTGGCTTYVDEYRCENTVQGPALEDTIIHVEEDFYDDTSCQREDDGSNCSSEDRCIEGAETRTINGLEVYRTCWKRERANSCERRENHNECQPYELYGEPISECLWTDREGVCQLFSNTYAVPTDDGSGGCHSYKNTYSCSADINELEHDAHVINITSTSYDNSECEILASNDNAHRVETTCLDQGNGPRAPPVVLHRVSDERLTIYDNTVVDRVEEQCWSEERDYRIETAEAVNTCTGAISNGCVLVERNCAQQSEISGDCSLDHLNYSCAVEGSDYCEVEDNEFSCVGPATASASQLSNLNGNLALYEPIDIRANVVRTYYDNSACTQATNFGSCELIESECSDSAGVNDPRPVALAQDEYFQQFVGYAPEQTHTCWEQTRIFDCGLPDNLDYCGSSVESCELENTDCLHQDPVSGACEIDVNIYACDTGTQATCSQTEADYVCDDPVEGETPNDTTNEQVTSEFDLSACVQQTVEGGEEVVADELYCEDPVSVCTEPGGVRHYGTNPSEGQLAYAAEPCLGTDDSCIGDIGITVPVEAECWNYQNTYNCTEVGEQFNDCAPAENCETTGSTCLSYDDFGNCLTIEHDYDCTTIEEVVLQEGTAGTCEVGETPREQSNPPNTTIEPLAALLGVAQADRETGQGEGFEIFSGTHRTCKRDIGGIRNCCQSSGLLLNLGLGSCSDSEIQLSVQKEENRCVDLGSYCSKKVFPGICTRRRTSYCCYEAEIGKIISEAGRDQLGKSYGDRENPDCSGFSVEEFQRLNLDNVDFSAVSSDIYGSLGGQDLSQYEGEAGNAVTRLLNGGQ